MKKMGFTFVLTFLMTVVNASQSMTVVTSFSILGDLTRVIGQEKVNVVEIVGAEQDVHTFQPRPQDVKKLVGARLVLVNGLGLEGWIARMVKASGYKEQVVEVSKALPALLNTEENEHDHGYGHHYHREYDPHVWQDPILMKGYVQNIANALAKVDPQNRAFYMANAKAYQAKLNALNQWVEGSLKVIPKAKRRVITSHDAFAYLGKRYHIQFMSLQGMSTDSEASAKDVMMLVQEIRKTGVKALFMENIQSPRLINMLAREAHVEIGGKLYSDALAKTGPASSYLGMYRQNIETLLSGLRKNLDPK